MILRGRGAGAAPGPTPRNFILLPDPGLIAEPDLYIIALGTRRAPDRVQARGETLLKKLDGPNRLRMVARAGRELAIAHCAQLAPQRLLGH